MSDAPVTPASTSSESVSTETQSQETSQEQQSEQPVVKKYKVKVDNQELEVDEAELLRGYGHNKAAAARFQEAAQMKKQAEQFVHLLKTDPIKVLTNPKLGIEFRKLAEEYLVSQLEEEVMDPKDRELRDAKKQLQAIEEEKKRIKAEEDERQAAELQRHYAEDYSNKIIKSLETSGLPKSEHTIKRMAYYMHEGMKRGLSLGPDDVVDLVKQDYIEEQKSLFGGLDGDMLIQLLGDDVASKIRKHDLAKLKAKPTQTQQYSGVSKTTPKESKRISKEQWSERMERIKRGEA